MSRNRFNSKLVASILLAVFFGAALYLRVVLPYDKVFVGDWVKLTGVDAYFFMRLVDNLVHNFPHLITFDPYLLYPGGSAVSTPIFWPYLISGVTWLIGFGSPTQHTVDMVGVFSPAVLGALTTIPVYFIGKTLFNRWAGVMAAGLVAVFPGEFLGRSTLGFADSHVAEVLFITVTMLFLILAVKAGSDKELTFGRLRHRQWATIMKPFIYSFLAGVFLGIYFLTWAGALLFVFIIFVYLVIQFIIDHLKSRSTDYLCFVSTITFIVALLIYLPGSPSMMFLASFFIAIVVPVVLAVLSYFMTSHNIKPIIYPAAIIGLGLLSLAVFRIVFPSLLQTMIGYLNIFFTWPTGTTVLEMEPLLFPGGNFSLSVAWGNFTTGFFLSFISLVILVYLVIKRSETEKTLFIIWSLVILAATLAMRRFAYYFVVNVALLASYLAWLILEFSGFKEKITEPVEALRETKREARLKKRGSPRPAASWVGRGLGVIAVFFLVFFPNIGKAINTASQAAFAPSDAWYESLSWLQNNTPDPFGNPQFYYELYQPPPPGERYNYPQTPYGVTAWWDYGYWITRIGHRIPTSTPGTGHKGEAAVFTAQDETSANYDTSGLGLFTADYVVLSKFIASSTGYITEIRLECFGSGNVKVAIYSDSGGEPGTLLDKVDASTAVVSGWNTIIFPATSVTSDTAYWLAFNSDAPIVYFGLTGGTCRVKAASYSTFTFPSSAGTGLNSSTLLLLQAGYGTASTPPSSTASMVTNASGASNITVSSARLNGNLTSTGGATTTIHICWGDSDGSTTPGNWANDINLGIKDAGAFYTDISGLTSGRTYHYRCYATNPGGIAWATNSASFLAQAIQIQKLIGADATQGWSPKYVIVDYSIVMPIGGKFHAVATLSGSSPERFFDVYYQPREDKLEPVILFYPEYYRSLLIRLYNFDGKQVVPSSSIVISFEERVSSDGQPYKEITSAKSFPSYEGAEAYVTSQKSSNYRIVSADPFASPVPLQALEHYKLVYSSHGSKMMPSGGLISEVKIFEYIR